MANAKGSIFINFKDYVIKNHGGEGWEKLIGILTHEEKELIGWKILPNRWYPMHIFKRLIEAYDNMFGDGSFHSIVPIAEHIADRDIVPFFLKFINLNNPSIILRNTTSLWKRYFDSGDIRIEAADDMHNCYRFLLDEFDDYSGLIFCTYMVSTWLKRILNVAGFGNITITYTTSQDDHGSPGILEVRWGQAS
ncbi:MAG: hypothetical protein QXI19_11115 [Candidatus Caldarchaeum sp.]